MRKGVAYALVAELNDMDPDEHLLPADVIELIYQVAQQEQLERCPIYGGKCCYPSELCFECPLHSMEAEG